MLVVQLYGIVSVKAKGRFSANPSTFFCTSLSSSIHYNLESEFGQTDVLRINFKRARVIGTIKAVLKAIFLRIVGRIIEQDER